MYMVAPPPSPSYFFRDLMAETNQGEEMHRVVATETPMEKEWQRTTKANEADGRTRNVATIVTNAMQTTKKNERRTWTARSRKRRRRGARRCSPLGLARGEEGRIEHESQMGLSSLTRILTLFNLFLFFFICLLFFSFIFYFLFTISIIIFCLF